MITKQLFLRSTILIAMLTSIVSCGAVSDEDAPITNDTEVTEHLENLELSDGETVERQHDSRELARSTDRLSIEATDAYGMMTPNEDEIDLSEVDKYLQNMASGNMAFNTPETVALEEWTNIQLILSPSATIEELGAQIVGEGQIVGGRVKISDQMEARLTGANWNIEPKEEQRTAVSKIENTEWQWSIQAKKGGPQVFNVQLFAFIELDDESVPRLIQTFNKEIIVEVTWTRKTTDYIDKNKEWLWTAIVGPGIAWFVKRRKRGQGEVESEHA